MRNWVKSAMPVSFIQTSVNMEHLMSAIAVDFPKTGKIVSMPFELKPKMYPDFMRKEKCQSYKLKKILGRLYRQIVDAYGEEVEGSSVSTYVPEDIPYDADLEIPGSTNFIADAFNHKCSYDRQLNGLLGQYGVMREEEVVIGHIWSMPKHNSRKRGKLQEKLGHAYGCLRNEFRQVFEQMGSDFDKLPDDQKNEIYEQKASAWYQVAYHPSWVKRSLELQVADQNAGEKVMLSFSWIAVDYLARIKIRRREIGKLDPAKPINSLARYLADHQM